MQRATTRPADHGEGRSAVDDPWGRFVVALNAEMGREPALTTKELTRRLATAGVSPVSEEKVSNWRRGRARPRLDELKLLVVALNEDRKDPRTEPLTVRRLLSDMGVLPPDVSDDDLFDRAYRLHKLNLKLEDAQVALAVMGKRAGAARIVQEAVTSRQWAVAVAPALEGPDPHTQMHVADRLTIARISGLTNDPDPKADIWGDAGMKSALRSTYALPSNAGSRWTQPPEGGEGHVTHWSISYVNSPREAVVPAPWEGLRSLAFVATTHTSWVKNVASLVGVALGYGLTTTPDLAMTMTHRAIDDTTHEDRERCHLSLTAAPPRRRVWAHYGVPSGAPGHFRNASDDRQTAPRYVFLDESDHQLTRAVGEGTPTTLKAGRQVYRDALSGLPDYSVLVLPCVYREERADRWEQSFEQVLATLTWLTDPNSGVRLPMDRLNGFHEEISRREPNVGIPLFAWLRTRGWPTGR